ncbi:putative Bracovirus protein MdBV-4-6 [Microplitis demolitor]
MDTFVWCNYGIYWFVMFLNNSGFNFVFNEFITTVFILYIII